MSKKLSARHECFVLEYLKNGRNATQGAIAAGYSKKTAYSIGSRLLTYPQVQAAIEERTQKALDALGIDADRILREVALIGFVNIAKAFNADGSLKPINEIPEDIQRALAGIDLIHLGEGVTLRKIKIQDKLAALKLLMAHKGMLVEKHEHKVSWEDVVSKSWPGEGEKGAKKA